MRSHALALVFLAAVVAAQPALALVSGGGSARSDCYAQWQVTSPDQAANRGRTGVDCTDGDPLCDADGQADGLCTFDVSVCVGVPDVPRCTAQPLTDAVIRPTLNRAARRAALPLPPVPQVLLGARGSACGPASRFTLPAGVGRRRAEAQFRLTARSSGRPGRDTDVLKLRCAPSTAPVTCPANAAGPDQPSEIVLTLSNQLPSDLDNGWSGASHNFPIPSNTTLQLCLANCDASQDPLCDTTIATGEGTFNGTTFGAPLPILAAGVPVCVQNRFAAPLLAGGTANIQTGEIDARVDLRSDVFITNSTMVCPRCENSRCDSGPNQGRPCAVDGEVLVRDSTAANRLFRLSKDCPVGGAPAGTLTINLPLTTGTSTLAPQTGGNTATPCVRQPGEPAGVPTAADPCGAGTCTAACSGAACVEIARDPVTGQPVCADAKGGVSQACCSNDTTRACFPTAQGPLTRIGRALAPQPAWPDPTYPKTSGCTAGNCLVQAATFCEPAAGGATVDVVAGLPGPGAIVLPWTSAWRIPPR